MTDSTENENDANIPVVPADDQRNHDADAGGTPKLNRVKIKNTTKPDTGFAIVGGVHFPERKKPN